jgi:hypothetical protein
MINMDKNQKTWLAFGILFGLTIIAIGLNGGFETNFGTINVSEITITTKDGLSQTGKLYLPEGVDSSNPAPGVLAIHGYNNDKHVQRPHSLEMAKRGVVVLAIDCIDHGDSDSGLFVWTTTPYEAYEWLEAQPFVNSNLTGVVGHSMGAGWARNIAVRYPQIDVIGYQAFGTERLGQFSFEANTTYADYFANKSTNWIQISSMMEEFGGRSYDTTNDEWYQYNLDQIALNTQITGVDDGTSEFFKTYGDVGAGTAQRYVWLWKTHPGQTHDLTATKEITSFFLQSFGMGTTPDDIRTTYIYAEICGAASALFLMLSIVPLVGLLLGTSTFSEVKQPIPEMKESLRTKKWVWWAFATLNFAIGGALYFFATDAPDGGIFLQNVFADSGLSWADFIAGRPFFFQNWIIDANNLAKWSTIESSGKVIFDMGVANAQEAFYIVNAIVNLCFVTGWYFIFGRKNRATSEDLGIYTSSENFGKNAKIFGKTILLAGVVFLYMYGMTIFSESVFNLEIRGPWSMFKTFTNERAVRFWLYFPGVLCFFILNGGIWLFGLMRQPEYGGEFKTSILWWLKVCFAMLTGIILLNIIGYFPVWIGTGGQFFQQALFGDAFAPMNLLQTWGMIPVGAAMYWIAVKYFRQTGRIWLGAIILATLTTWIMVTGTVIDPFVL